MRKEQRLEKKKKTLKQRLLGVFQVIMLLTFIISCLVFLFHGKARDIVIKRQSDKYVITNVNKEIIEKNQDAEVSFDFSAVEPLSSESIIGSQLTSVLPTSTENPLDNLPVVAGIAIPDLGINLPIFKGVDNTSLWFGAGTMKPDQQMGKGNYALASHHLFDELGVSNGSQLLFTPLDNAKKGQLIYLTDLTNVYVYAISSIENVDPKSVQVIEDNPNGKAEVTLVTCEDLYAERRIIVKGTLIETTSYDKSPYKAHFSSNYNQYNG